MAKSTVKRRRKIRSYAGFTTGAAKYTIQPLTEKTFEYTMDFVKKRTTRRTGNLEDGLVMEYAGALTGIVKFRYSGRAEGGANHAHLLEYGTIHMKARPMLRPGARKAKRELKAVWKDGLKAAKNEQSVRS